MAGAQRGVSIVVKSPPNYAKAKSGSSRFRVVAARNWSLLLGYFIVTAGHLLHICCAFHNVVLSPFRRVPPPDQSPKSAPHCGGLFEEMRSHGMRRIGETPATCSCDERPTRRLEGSKRIGRMCLLSSTGAENDTAATADANSAGQVGEVFLDSTCALLDRAELRWALSQDEDSKWRDNLTLLDAIPEGTKAASRRRFVASALLTAGLSLGTNSGVAPASASELQYEKSPVNKRSGVSLTDAEKSGYNVRFVTYLSRILLAFDADCQKWWYARAAGLPRTGTAEEVNAMRLKQFGAFSASVEVGLQEFCGQEGPKRLIESLLRRYCPDMEQLKQSREQESMPPLSAQAEARQIREIKEARRQIALLFGLMQMYQPVEDITKLLAAIDNGSVKKVLIEDGGSGYAPGYGPPAVTFPSPEAGEGYKTATGRAVLKPNGRILRIDLVNRGFGYSKPPTVTVSPPAIATKALSNATVCTATGRAVLFRDGVNKGRIERIQLVDPGAGYIVDEHIDVTFSPPELSLAKGGVTATGTVIPELEVGGIEIVNGGSGYAAERPLQVHVDPPPVTARVNMMDPLVARAVDPRNPLPPTTIPTRKMKAAMLSVEDPMSVSGKASSFAWNAGAGGGGGCIGRGCYDRPVKATAYPRGEESSYDSFRTADDPLVDNAADTRDASSSTVRGTNPDSSFPPFPIFGGGSSSSKQLLYLLPRGVGLEYDAQLKRYTLAAGENFESMTAGKLPESPLRRQIDPEFGPRGRSPIERERDLDASTVWRFYLSGAICCSAVHLALTPIDVVKTKVQTNPNKGIVVTFQSVLEKGGFFAGWVPTFVGFFIWGGFVYLLTEVFRRTFTELAGMRSVSFEVPIILAAGGLSAVVGSFILAPFESVRIRSVAQPDFAKDAVGVVKRIVEEEGIASLFSAVPAFLVKEIPFGMAKFAVFDLSTAWLYDKFPAAREDLQLSLLVSLAGGSLGGIAAAFVSNPADVTITEMKKGKSDVSPQDAANIVLQRGGISELWKGIQLRIPFYILVVSLQFLVYDAVRFSLGIGTDDMKMYLDILGSALREGGGPV